MGVIFYVEIFLKFWDFRINNPLAIIVEQPIQSPWSKITKDLKLAKARDHDLWAPQKKNFFRQEINPTKPQQVEWVRGGLQRSPNLWACQTKSSLNPNTSEITKSSLNPTTRFWSCFHLCKQQDTEWSKENTKKRCSFWGRENKPKIKEIAAQKGLFGFEASFFWVGSDWEMREKRWSL